MGTIASEHYKFYSPMRAKFQLRNLQDNIDFYAFNPFDANAVSGQPLKLVINRGLGHHGNVSLLMDDDGGLDKTLFRAPYRIKIQLGKNNGDWTNYIHTLIRKATPVMHQNGGRFLWLSSYGLGQRSNERVLEFDRTTPDVLEDGVTLDTADVQQQADEMIKDTIGDFNEYPSDIMSNQTEEAFGYLDDTFVKSSGFNDYIHSIQARFVLMQDVWNIVEDFTFGRVTVDYDREVRFTPFPTPVHQSRGFILTRKANRDIDDADTTCQIIDSTFNFEDSFLIDSGYAGRTVGILDGDVKPDENNPPSNDGNVQNQSFEIAQLVKFPTNPNWEFWALVQINDGTDADRHAQRSRWRICKTTNDGLIGDIMNVGGIVDSFYGYEDGYNITDGGAQWLKIKTGGPNIDSEKYYWLILSSVNASPTTGWWDWYFTNGSRSWTATNAPNASTATDGGAGWTYNRGGRSFIHRLLRYKQQPITMSFDGAIKARGFIEQPIGTFNQQVNTYLGALKYMLATGRMRSSPQRMFNGISIRVPNKPIFEGDLFQIQVPEYNLSKPGKRAEYGITSDVTYVMGNETTEQDGFTALGTKTMQISIKTYPFGY